MCSAISIPPPAIADAPGSGRGAYKVAADIADAADDIVAADCADAADDDADDVATDHRHRNAGSAARPPADNVGGTARQWHGSAGSSARPPADSVGNVGGGERRQRHGSAGFSAPPPADDVGGGERRQRHGSASNVGGGTERRQRHGSAGSSAPPPADNVGGGGERRQRHGSAGNVGGGERRHDNTKPTGAAGTQRAYSYATQRSATADVGAGRSTLSYARAGSAPSARPAPPSAATSAPRAPDGAPTVAAGMERSYARQPTQLPFPELQPDEPDTTCGRCFFGGPSRLHPCKPHTIVEHRVTYAYIYMRRFILIHITR